eukprot:scaffold994_cov226-Prasinococcus_capsulatus_cf.AAC.18
MAYACPGVMQDNALPEAELKRTESEMRKADLVLCLVRYTCPLRRQQGCNQPGLTQCGGCLRNGGRMVIVNLQKTPMDKKAHLVIHAKADEVMHFIMTQLVSPRVSRGRSPYGSAQCSPGLITITGHPSATLPPDAHARPRPAMARVSAETSWAGTVSIARAVPGCIC